MSYGSDPDDFPELSEDFWSDPDDYPELSEDYEAKESDTQKSKNNGARDRLSELPDSLILLILSFLPMRYVVRTSLLSKRWKDLWTTVPCLDFSDDENDSGKLQAFVNRTLIRWRGTKILKFKINLLFNMSLSSDIDFWVRFAMENEVEELYVSLIKDRGMMIFEETGYWAPQRLYSCSSIKKLSLLCCNLEIHRNVHWDQLKSLRIDGVCLNEHVIDQVLSGTPQLEVLMLLLRESNEDLNIQSRSLKRLTIEKYLTVDDNVATDTVLRIWAPNVETLVISGILYSKCMLMNVSSLTDATLGFRGPNGFGNHKTREAELLREMLRKIFPTIHHVDKVTLSDWCIKELGVMEKKYLVSSSSSDVKFLKLNAGFIELDKIVDLLEIFPNLKMLVIEDTNHILKESNHEILYCPEGHVRERRKFDAENYLDSETNFPKSFLLQLRTVEITWFLCDTSIFPFIEFLLKHANMLEKMVIRARGIKSIAPKSLFLAAQKMLSMPRSSPTAKVILCEK